MRCAADWSLATSSNSEPRPNVASTLAPPNPALCLEVFANEKYSSTISVSQRTEPARKASKLGFCSQFLTSLSSFSFLLFPPSSPLHRVYAPLSFLRKDLSVLLLCVTGSVCYPQSAMERGKFVQLAIPEGRGFAKWQGLAATSSARDTQLRSALQADRGRFRCMPFFFPPLYPRPYSNVTRGLPVPLSNSYSASWQPKNHYSSSS